MESIDKKIFGIIIAVIIGSAFLPLLSYWTVVEFENETINSLWLIIPVFVIIGLGLNYLKGKKDSV